MADGEQGGIVNGESKNQRTFQGKEKKRRRTIGTGGSPRGKTQTNSVLCVWVWSAKTARHKHELWQKCRTQLLWLPMASTSILEHINAP